MMNWSLNNSGNGGVTANSANVAPTQQSAQQPVQMQMNFSQGQLQNGYEINSQATQKPVQQPVAQPQSQSVQQVEGVFEGDMDAYYDSIQSQMIPDEGEMLGATNVVQQPQLQNYGNSYGQSYGNNYQSGYSYNAPQQPQYVTEPLYYPTKLLNKFTMRTKSLSTGLEFLTDGFNLTSFAKNQDGSQGRLISFDSKLHLNMWTYDNQNHQVDFVPVYCDLSKFAALAMMVQNGTIFPLTEDYKRRKAQADAQAQNGQRVYANPIWENLGGTTKSQRYTVNRQQLNVPCVSTRLSLEPAQKPNAWLLKVTLSEGVMQQNGAIGPGKFIKSLFFTLDYVQLCEIATFTLAIVNANVSAIVTKRAFDRKGV